MGNAEGGMWNGYVELGSWNAEGLVKKMSIERPTSNVELEKMKKQKIVIQCLTLDFFEQMKFNWGGQRHHYSMFNVGRSMFDVHL